MRYLSSLLLLGLIGCSPSKLEPVTPPQLEPCYQLEFENNYVFQGKPEKEVHSAYTAAELPWIETDFTTITRLEFGFQQKEEPASIELQGKTVEGKKISWERDKRTSSNVAVGAVHAWLTPKLHSPAFMVTLGNKVKFLVPAGCVKLEVVAHQPPGNGIDGTEFRSTLSAKGEYQKQTKYKIGEKEYEAHEFSIEIPQEYVARTHTYVIAQEVPGAIFARFTKGTSNSSMEVKSLAVVPPPAKIEYFPKEGFAYAPPFGYDKVTPAKDEVASYRNGSKNFQVKMIELPKGGLLELKKLAQLDDRPAHIPKWLTENSNYHVAGHLSFTGAFPASLVTQHGKRGYLIAISGLNDLPNEEVKEILKGWRWISEPVGK